MGAGLGLLGAFAVGVCVNIAKDPWGFLGEYWLPLLILAWAVVLMVREARKETARRDQGRW
jgi:hypothetical protein